MKRTQDYLRFESSRGRERRRRPEGICSLLTVMAAGLAVVPCGCKKEQAPPPPPPIVVVMDLAPTNVPLSVEFIGQLDSPTNVDLRARVEAFVEAMPFVEGSNVFEGQLLFQLDKKPFEQRLSAAQGSLAEAKAALSKYQTDTNRLGPLAAKRAVPQQDLDNALASVDMAQANVLTATSRVEYAVLDLGYCDVKAPVSGLIGAKQVAIGDLVGKGQPTLLATISTLDPIWFSCNISEVQFLRAASETVRSGKKVANLAVTLIRTDGSEHPDKGRFVFIDRAVDIKTGTMRARAEFHNPQEILRPGMFGRIRVDLGVRTNSIVVPEKAVTDLQGNNFVWVVSKDNKSAQRPVTLGQQVGESFLVVKGLEPGERIIVEGLQKARQDQLVKPMTVAQAAEAAAKAAKEAEAKQAETRTAKEGEAKHGKE